MLSIDRAFAGVAGLILISTLFKDVQVAIFVLLALLSLVFVILEFRCFATHVLSPGPNLARAAAILALAIVLAAVLSQSSWSGIRDPFNILWVALISFAAWRSRHLTERAFFMGAWLACIVVGLVAIYDVAFVGESRASRWLNANQFGALSMLVSGILLLSFPVWKGRVPRTLWSIGIALGLIGALLSFSRAAWLGVPFLALLAVLSLGKSGNERCHLVWLLAPVVIITIVTVANHERVAARFKQFDQIYQVSGSVDPSSSDGIRMTLATIAIKNLMSDPLAGIGFGNLRESNRLRWEAGEPSSEHLRSHVHVHSQYLECASSGGLVYLAGYLYFLLAAFRFFVAARATSGPMAYAGLWAVIAMMTYGIFEVVLFDSRTVFMYGAAIALAGGIVQRNFMQSKGS